MTARVANLIWCSCFWQPAGIIYGPFKLFCDPPANVLAASNSNFSVVGAIDWECLYAAPAEFVYSLPSWLLLELPEYWPKVLMNRHESMRKVWRCSFKCFREGGMRPLNEVSLPKMNAFQGIRGEVGKRGISGLTMQQGGAGRLI